MKQLSVEQSTPSPESSAKTPPQEPGQDVSVPTDSKTQTVPSLFAGLKTLCLRCQSPTLYKGSIYCVSCVRWGKKKADNSIQRQLAAGLPLVRGIPRNWQVGDPFWWEASGLYKKGTYGTGTD